MISPGWGLAWEPDLVMGAICRGVGVAVVGGLLALVMAVAGPVEAQTLGDVGLRDRLIAEQEALLDAYRCRFAVDVGEVDGGCAGGSPAAPAAGPGSFAGVPSAQDVAVRDELIAAQEALLNVYRCGFDIDTELVPGGCDAAAADDPGAAAESELVPVSEGFSFQGVDITDLVDEAIARGGLGPEGEQVGEEIVAAEVAMGLLVELLRVEQGLDRLAYDLRLVRVAREWSQEMATTGDFSHNPSYSDQYPPGWWLAAENISLYYLPRGESGWEALSATVVDAFEGLSNSPGHYANMVNPDITSIGVGIAIDDRKVYITQNFAAYR